MLLCNPIQIHHLLFSSNTETCTIKHWQQHQYWFYAMMGLHSCPKPNYVEKKVSLSGERNYCEVVHLYWLTNRRQTNVDAYWVKGFNANFS